MTVVILLLTTDVIPVAKAAMSPLRPRLGMNLNSVLKRYENIWLDPLDGSRLSENPDARSEAEFAAGLSGLPVHFAVRAFGRNLSVHLQRGESIFTSDAQVIVHDGGQKVKAIPARNLKTNYVEGYVVGEANSSVRGHLVDGVFTGILTTGDSTYYVEPAHKFFDHANVSEAIIYEESDVRLTDPHSKDNAGAKFCLTKPSYYWPVSTPTRTSDGVFPEVDVLPAVVFGKVCKVKAVADPRYFGELNRGDVDRTVASMEIHLKEVDEMYKATDFDGDGRPDGVRVRMTKAEVFESLADPRFLMSDPRINVSAYLDLFTRYDHRGFCAALAFTFVPFEDNVMGYAFRGSPGHAGGICYPEVSDGDRKRNLNVGLATFAASFGTVLLAQGSVLVAHELGHMFGSRHDEDVEGGACFSEPEDRHYIMSSMANPGTSATNRQFSPCSLKWIRNNLRVHGQCLHCRGWDCGGGHWSPLAQALLWTCMAIHLIST